MLDRKRLVSYGLSGESEGSAGGTRQDCGRRIRSGGLKRCRARRRARHCACLAGKKPRTLSDTIYKYQRGKYIMATPDQLPLRSDLPFEAGSRESIIDNWDDTTEALNVNVRLNSEVTAISGSKGNFSITLKDGETVQAEFIVLAVGVQGNPNKVRQPGGDLPFVQYQLDDPKEHYDENIIVIGGGDAGIENALGLAADPQPGAMW